MSRAVLDLPRGNDATRRRTVFEVSTLSNMNCWSSFYWFCEICRVAFMQSKSPQSTELAISRGAGWPQTKISHHSGRQLFQQDFCERFLEVREGKSFL